MHGAIVSILDLNGNILTEKIVLPTRLEVVEFNFPDIKGRFVRINQPNNILDIGEAEVHGKWLTLQNAKSGIKQTSFYIESKPILYSIVCC